jgi:pimeloyl-ACP methyl ester carboxylesterase
MQADFVTRRGPGGMVVAALGNGPSIVFVHGLGDSGPAAWPAQRPLAARWRLVCPHRPGYGGSPRTGREDFEADAALIAELLGDGAHLVGQGYGAVVALLAAAQRPRHVWSLTAIEPPSPSPARGDPDVDRYEQGLLAPTGAPLDGPRSPREAEFPLDVLMAATFPKLFISSGHNPAHEAICDALALQIGGDRKLMRGLGTSGPPDAAFNAVLESFMQARPLP